MNLAVVGTGLIGGSVGMAARRRLGAHVRGTGRRAPLGVALGALDAAFDTIGEALPDADVAVLCAPVDGHNVLLEGGQCVDAATKAVLAKPLLVFPSAARRIISTVQAPIELQVAPLNLGSLCGVALPR